jgi:heat shock protein HslJ
MRWTVDLRHIPVACAAAALALALAACAGKPPTRPAEPSIVGLWRAQEITGAPVPADARVTLSLYGDGRAVGRAGCNNYTTKYKRDGAAISFSPVISTRMACAPDLMALEQSYLGALGAATRLERRPDGVLVLTGDGAGAILFRREEADGVQDARSRGIDFRAVGQEPGWVVELTEGGQISAVLDYGATSLQLPTPWAEAAGDGTVTYDASSDTDHLVLNITDKVCIDSMSGQAHPSTVRLMVNDKAYAGCGDWLD